MMYDLTSVRWCGNLGIQWSLDIPGMSDKNVSQLPVEAKYIVINIEADIYLHT